MHFCRKPWRVADKEGLEERRGMASLYVGETARPVSGRAQEHWREAEGGKEENHRVTTRLRHMVGMTTPSPMFKFKVKSILERQVREAVIIQMRGKVLNKK